MHDLELLIKDGEFLVLVGPSGCGKTTALRVRRRSRADHGRRDQDRRPGRQPRALKGPQHRDGVPVVRALPAHDRVRQPRVRPEALKTPKQEIRRRVEEAAKILNLDHLLDRKPKALSGGQRQRVALGRAIVREPAAFLMDEPLSNLDAKLRVQTRAEILRLQQRLGTTTIYVTHDQVEAMTMGDRIAVMRDGYLQQVGSPPELYTRPVNMFVAGFIGSPAMNFATGARRGRRPQARRAPSSSSRGAREKAAAAAERQGPRDRIPAGGPASWPTGTPPDGAVRFPAQRRSGRVPRQPGAAARTRPKATRSLRSSQARRRFRSGTTWSSRFRRTSSISSTPRPRKAWFLQVEWAGMSAA